MPPGAQQPATYAPPGGAQPTGQRPMAPPPDQSGPGGGPGGVGGPPAMGPAVDVVDGPRAVAILVDLPGCDKEAIDIEANGHAVRILASRDTDPDERERTVQRERPTRFERVVELPASVDIEESEATYENGVLAVTLPKTGDERRRTIGIH